jgi:hypothetical protein
MLIANITFGVLAAFLILYVYGMHLSGKERKNKSSQNDDSAATPLSVA